MFPIKQNISLKNKPNQTNKLQFKKIPWEKAQVSSLEISWRNFSPLTSWALCLPFWLPPDLKFPFKADKHGGKLEGEKNLLWIDGSGWRKRSYSNESITSCVQEKRTKCTLHTCPNCSTCLHNLKASLITNHLKLFELLRQLRCGNVFQRTAGLEWTRGQVHVPHFNEEETKC